MNASIILCIVGLLAEALLVHVLHTMTCFWCGVSIEAKVALAGGCGHRIGYTTLVFKRKLTLYLIAIVIVDAMTTQYREPMIGHAG